MKEEKLANIFINNNSTESQNYMKLFLETSYRE